MPGRDAGGEPGRLASSTSAANDEEPAAGRGCGARSSTAVQERNAWPMMRGSGTIAVSVPPAPSVTPPPGVASIEQAPSGAPCDRWWTAPRRRSRPEARAAFPARSRRPARPGSHPRASGSHGSAGRAPRAAAARTRAAPSPDISTRQPARGSNGAQRAACPTAAARDCAYRRSWPLPRIAKSPSKTSLQPTRFYIGTRCIFPL